MRRAVYGGSFDPVTNGHLYVIREGARLFDGLVVAVGTNPKKDYTFSEEERLGLVRKAVEEFKNVSVESLGRQFLVEFASGNGARWLLRGVRDESDFRTELFMRRTNSLFRSELTTVFVMAPPEMAAVSSSFVKGLVGLEGWKEKVARLVPPHVLEALEALEAAP